MDDSDALKELLRTTECFAGMDDTLRALLAARMRKVAYPAGARIFAEGAAGKFMFIVASGALRVLKRSETGALVQIDVVGPGQCGGMTSLLLAEPRSATLEASNDVMLWILRAEDFDQLVTSRPEFARALLAFMSRHIRREARLMTRLAPGGGAGLKVAVFDTKEFTRRTFTARNTHGYALTFFDHRLTLDTVASAMGFPVLCPFVNDQLDGPVIARLKGLGVGLIALRSAGYNNVDLAACDEHGISVARVPEYSPHSVAEHALALMLALNRRLTRAHDRVQTGNFSLEGLVGFEMRGKTVGVVGTGHIGKALTRILLGLGCRVLGYDVRQDPELAECAEFAYTSLDALLHGADIITLHVPLLPQTEDLINAEAIAMMKPGVMLINTSRGGLIDTQALIEALKNGQVGSAGLDVYEEESAYFFEDFSGRVITDDLLARLLTFNNVIVTSHQAFLTQEALDNIADTTFANIREYQLGKRGSQITNGVCYKCGH